MTKDLCELAKATVAELLAKTGHQLTLDDFGDIAELDALARRVERPDDPRAFDLLRIPVQVPGTSITLRPVSIARAEWMRRHVARLFADDVLQYAAMCYALSVADSRHLFVRTDDEHRAAVADLVASIDVAPTELVACMERVMRFDDGGEQGEGGGDPAHIYGPLIASLAREYNGTPDYWLHDANLDTVEAMLDDLWRRQDSELATAAAQAGAKHSSSLWREAIGHMRTKEIEIKRKWSGDDGQ